MVGYLSMDFAETSVVDGTVKFVTRVAATSSGDESEAAENCNDPKSDGSSSEPSSAGTHGEISSFMI